MHLLLDVSIRPDGSALPGFGTIQDLVNAASAFALLGCLAAAILGGVIWAFGATSSNVAAASKGQKTVVASGLGAAVVGAAAILVNFFYHMGQGLH